MVPVFNFIALSGDTAIDNPAIAAKTADFQLSQEESGLSLILQDVSNNKEYLVQLNLEKVWFTNLTSKTSRKFCEWHLKTPTESRD